MVGFRMPEYMEGLNVPGYHFHFITDDRKAGGHVLDCLIEEAMVEIDYSSGFHMKLPENDGFFKADLANGEKKDPYKLEKR